LWCAENRLVGRSTGDQLVVADADFETEHLQDVMTVANLDGE
jgi:hypothetical protein